MPTDGATAACKPVLHIEDRLHSLPLLETFAFSRWPEVRLLAARRGHTGLQLAREHQPALILLHLDLPDLPGQEVLERLKWDDRTAAIPVLTVGGAETAPQALALQRLGATAHFTQPLALPPFLRVVDALLA